MPDSSHRNAFHVAATNRSCTNLKLLMDSLGEVPMLQDSSGNTPLHYAVRYGKKTIFLKILISY
jgi:ankyrin repeat protein